MASVVRMPAALAGVTEAAVQTWLVQPGQRVAEGDLLAEIETEKAVVEYVAEVAGTVGRLLVPEGSAVEVGVPIVVILEDGEGEDAIGPALEAAGAAAPAPGPGSSGHEVQSEPQPDARSRSGDPAAGAGSAWATTGWPAEPAWRFASPLVRRLAHERGLDLAEVPGTGPHGRIVRRDLERFVQSRASARRAGRTARDVRLPALLRPAPPASACR